MMAQILSMVKQTLKSPREGAEAVIAIAPQRQFLWLTLLLIVSLSVLLTQLVGFIAPLPPDTQPVLPFSHDPILAALVFWGLMILMVFCTHYIGRAFGGKGRFDDSLALVIWLQTIMVVLQVLQIVLLLISPFLAMLMGVVGMVLFIWLYVNFVAVVHHFETLGLVFFGILISMIGVLFGVSLIASIIAVFLGVELPNA